MTKKYPRPCKDCTRSMRPKTKGSEKQYPNAETVHHSRGRCKACAERQRRGDTHLAGQPIRTYGRNKPLMTSLPVTFPMLMEMGKVHPPTAKYIVDRRLRGVPTEGLRKRAA